MKLVLAGLLLTAPIVHGACYTSTYDIFQDITNNNVKVVEICPGTQFDIGFPVDKNFVEFAGGFPLIITGDDITVKCGSNGLSSNNCVFNGGFVQLLTGSIFGDTSSTSNNLKVQGLTFRGGGGLDSVFEEEWDSRPIVTGNEGIGIVFDDCIFEDMNTGYVFDLTQASEGTVTVEITDSVFRNIQHRFSLINALTQTVTLNKVAFENVEHVEPGQVDVCKDKAEGACEYSSSVIAADSASLIDVTMTDVNYYTSLLLTKELLTLPGEPLITTNNIEIFDEGNRTINEDYCKGGYAAEADATGLEFKCFRLTSDVSVFDFIECGEDCREDGKYSEFIKILNATKLEEMLADEGDITLFIPTNDAINGLPNGLLDNLLEEEGLDTLTALVKYHVITKNVVDSAAIKLGYPASETFLQGEFVKYAFQDGIVYVNDAKVVEADWEEKPGTNTGSIVHSINKFLAPDSIPIYPSIGELVALTPTFSSLDAAMTSIGYARDLTLNKTYTLFAPSNDAMENSAKVQRLLGNAGGPKTDAQNELDKKDLETIFLQHMVEGRYRVEDFKKDGCLSLQTVAGKTIKVQYQSPDILINDKVKNGVLVDLEAHNGIVHEVGGIFSINDNLCPSDIEDDNDSTSSGSGHLQLSFLNGLLSMVVGFIGAFYM